MLSVHEYLEQQQLANLYPWMEAKEKELREQNIDPDKWLNEQLLLELDPIIGGALGAAGAMALKKGYDALGGWQGIKGLAKTGWDGVKRTWGDLKAQHATNKMAGDRQQMADLAARTGTKVSIPIAKRADTIAINKLARDAGNILNNVNSTSDVVKNNPQVQNLIAQITQALAGLQQATQSVATAPTPATP
jgi:hypothetical protein